MVEINKSLKLKISKIKLDEKFLNEIKKRFEKSENRTILTEDVLTEKAHENLKNKETKNSKSLGINKKNIKKPLKKRKQDKGSKNDLDFDKSSKSIEVLNQTDSKISKKILMVASEVQPFCATGGMADVCGSLPKEIKRCDESIDMRVVLPLYSIINKSQRENFKFLGFFYTTLSWRREYCGVYELKKDNVTYYFLDNERYFKRDYGLYGYYDDGERFAFFSKSVLEMLPMIDFFPDIIHCNDWQSALIPVYLKTTFFDDRYSSIKNVLSIHNIEYQGRFGQEILVDVFGIDEKFRNLLSYNGDINVLKAGIVCADKLITVSPSYASEIKTATFSSGLHHIINKNCYKLTGILNGIDYEFYDPSSDSEISQNYSIDSINDKAVNKENFQREFNLKVDKDIPLIGFCSRMNKHKGFDLIKCCMEKIIAENNVQFVGVGCGDHEYEEFFKYLNFKYPDKVHISLGFSLSMGRKIYSASDIYIMPSFAEPCGLSQIIASRYGVVPVVHETGGLRDTIKDFGCEGGGNGYTFSGYSAGDFEYSVKRAVEDFKNKDEWRKKVAKVMSMDFSWNKTAKEYTNIYLGL